jgi:hypothetical protein
MLHKSSKRRLVIAATSALVLGAIVFLNAVNRLNRYFEPHPPTTHLDLTNMTWPLHITLIVAVLLMLGAISIGYHGMPT